MVPSNIEGKHKTLGAPLGKEKEVGGLDIVIAIDKNMKDPCFISEWALEEGELEEIQRTGKVYLKVIGNGHPPVALSGSRFEEHTEHLAKIEKNAKIEVPKK